MAASVGFVGPGVRVYDDEDEDDDDNGEEVDGLDECRAARAVGVWGSELYEIQFQNLGRNSFGCTCRLLGTSENRLCTSSLH